MTRTTNARIAGTAFLVYIAAGITSLILFNRATDGDGIAAKLTALAAHASDVGFLVILGLVQVFSALALAVSLYALTRDADPDLAMIGLVCRAAEGIIGGLAIPATLALVWLATSRDPAQTADAAGVHTLAAYLLRDNVALTATFFAVGSLAFCYLLLRARMIPSGLAWLGVVASVLLVVALPLRLAGWLPTQLMMLLWLPMLAFEVPFGVWLLVKGVAPPTTVAALGSRLSAHPPPRAEV